MENSTIMQPQPQKIAVSSQLMQNYRLATPWIAGGSVVTAYNGTAKQTEVLTVGSDGHLYDLYPDGDSDTGWSSIDMAFPGPVKTFDACALPDGSVRVYGVDTKDTLYSNSKTGVSWEGWVVSSEPVTISLSAADLPKPYVKASLLELKVRYFDGDIYLWGTQGGVMFFALFALEDQSGNRFQSSWCYFPKVMGRGSWTPNDLGVFPLYTATLDWCVACVRSANIERDGNPGAYVSGNLGLFGAFGNNGWETLGPTGPGLESWDSWSAVPFARLIDGFGAYQGLTVARGAGGKQVYDELFAVRDTAAFQLHCDGDGPPIGHTSTLPGYFAPVKRSGDIPVSTIAVHTTLDGLIELFALGTDKSLYSTRQQEDDPSSWSPFIQLERNLPFVRLIAGSNANLYSEVFAITADNRLMHVWQGTAGENWHFDLVELSTSGTLEEISTYTMQLTVFDAQDVPAPGTAVRIYSDTPVVLDVNGVTCLVQANAPWDCGSLANGNVTIGMRVDGLGMPLLRIWTAFMPENDRVPLDASAPVRDRLQQIDANQLNAAQVTDDRGRQTPLLNATAQKATPSLVQTLHASMQAAAKLEAPPTSAAQLVHFHRLNDHRVARYQVAGAPQLAADTSTLPVWSLDFTSGLPVFTALSAEQADQLRAAQMQLPDIATLTTQSSSTWDWGSVFAAIEDGLFGLASAFVDGLKVTLNMIVDGVAYVYHAVINFVEQVFDLVEEAFHAVGVFFDQLFRWLGHIFGWDDILRSQEAIEHLWDQMQQFLRAGILKVRSVAEPGGLIDGYKRDVSKQFDCFLANILPPGEQFGSLGSDSSTPPTPAELALHQSAGINVFRDGLMQGTAGKTTPVAWLALPRTAALTAAVDDLSSALASTSQSFQASDAFKSALDYFEAIPDHPDQFLQLVAAAIVRVVEGITLFALDAAAAVITALCNAVLAVLDEVWNLLHEPWDVPLLSALYARYTNGQTLTTINVLALLVATPATVLYKLVNGKTTFPDNDPSAAPFPDQASLDAFKSTVTVQWLIQQAGLASSVSGSAATASLVVNPVLLVARRFCKVCYALNSLVYVGTDFVIDLTAQPNPENYWKDRWKPDPTTFSRLAYAHAWMEPIFSIPWLMGSQADEFGNLVWWLQLIIGVSLDTVAFWSEGKVTREGFRGAGVWVHSLWGAANLGLYITKAVKVGGADRAGSAREVLSVIPGPFKWMSKYPGRTTPVGAIMCLALLGLDVVCDVSVTGIAIAEVFTSENDGSAGMSEASAAPQ